MKTRSIALRAALAALALSSASQAGTLYVDSSVTPGLDGSSWTTAFGGTNGLAVALHFAESGDEIYVRQGTYTPLPIGVLDRSFYLKDNVQVYGGFLGTESSPLERPPFGEFPSILTGDVDGNDAQGIFSDNSVHVVNCNSTSASTVLDGFVITGGNASATASAQFGRGGGIFAVSGSRTTIRHCSFVSNRSGVGGGAGLVESSSPTFEDCTFFDNDGGNYGGALLITGAGAIGIDRCEFSGNRAAVGGGAVAIFSATGCRISNSLFFGNEAAGVGGGGAIWDASSSGTEIRNCTVVANTATNQAQAGLRNQGSSVTTTNSIFWDNVGTGVAQNAANQTNSPASYSIIEGGAAGVGNLNLDPQFEDAPGGDFSLSSSSPGIDAGNNAAVPAGVVLDRASAPRFVDVVAVADTGSGTAPLVDIGAFERQRSPFKSFCFGDGSGTPCPCMNDSNAGHPGGCAHQDGQGAILTPSGTPNVSNDTLHFDLSSAVTNSFALLVSGDNQLSQMGGCIGCGLVAFDGLRCAGGNFLLHGSRGIDATGSTTNGWGPPAAPAGGILAQSGFTAGQTRNFFAFFRTNSALGCGGGQNSSNGVSMTFGN